MTGRRSNLMRKKSRDVPVEKREKSRNQFTVDESLPEELVGHSGWNLGNLVEGREKR